MSEKIKIADLPDFEMAEQLENDEAIAEYLTLVLEENDPTEFTHALSVSAQARGMNSLAKTSGIEREALYKALRPNAKPSFDTINRICAALGLKLVAQVMRKEEVCAEL